MPARSEFLPVFQKLRSLLEPYAPRLEVVHDTPGYYSLDTRTLGRNKRPIMFAGVRILKGYVSYYFMPIYAGAAKGMSPALKRHMQGKACFNFTQVDPELFAELGDVTRKGYESWKKIGWVD